MQDVYLELNFFHCGVATFTLAKDLCIFTLRIIFSSYLTATNKGALEGYANPSRTSLVAVQALILLTSDIVCVWLMSFDRA